MFNNRSVNVPAITSVRTQPPTYMLIPCRDLEIKVQKQQQQNIEYPTWSQRYAAFIFQFWYLKSHQMGGCNSSSMPMKSSKSELSLFEFTSPPDVYTEHLLALGTMSLSEMTSSEPILSSY